MMLKLKPQNCKLEKIEKGTVEAVVINYEIDNEFQIVKFYFSLNSLPNSVLSLTIPLELYTGSWFTNLAFKNGWTVEVSGEWNVVPEFFIGTPVQLSLVEVYGNIFITDVNPSKMWQMNKEGTEEFGGENE